MNTVVDALETLKNLLRLDRLSFDDDGQAAIIVENAITIDISRQSETEIEFSTTLDALIGELTLSRLIVLMQANYLGHYTGAARIALDPRDGVPVLCQHVDVQSLDDADLERALVNFIGFATYWLDEGVERILDIPEIAPSEVSDVGASDDHVMLRL